MPRAMTSSSRDGKGKWKSVARDVQNDSTHGRRRRDEAIVLEEDGLLLLLATVTTAGALVMSLLPPNLCSSITPHPLFLRPKSQSSSIPYARLRRRRLAHMCTPSASFSASASAPLEELFVEQQSTCQACEERTSVFQELE